MSKNNLIALLFLLFAGPMAIGQESLDLFQATENPDENRANSRQPQREDQRVTEPAFTLVGTSRFGEEYYASLLHRDGTPVRVEWKPGRTNEIKGYNGFGLAQIGSRYVSLSLPENEPCVASEIKGVSCNGQYAVLSLTNAAPIVRAAPERPVNSSQENSEAGTRTSSDNEAEEAADPGQETIGNSNVLLRNPFSGELQSAQELSPEELAEREQRRQERAERFRNFELVRIADDEIPEGMRRVRTPFGDRLEPIEE